MKPLWLYGKGNLGNLAREFFACRGIEVAGSFEHDEPAPLEAQVAVCIVTAPYTQIRLRLDQKGFKDVVPFYDLSYSVRGDHPLENGWRAPPEDGDKITEVMKRWSDDASRIHHSQFVGWRIFRCDWWLTGEIRVSNDEQHFIPEVVKVLRSHEVFLDGGSYHGKSTARLKSLVPDSDIIAVEPDFRNREHFRDAYSFALAAEDGSANFAEGYGLCSKLMPQGRVVVATRSIDSLDISPTFIKLHLEGGELAALRGAEQTLVRCRPIVAANVDHNVDGLWRTADYLMNLLPDYRFLFRNHCWCGSGAVVYAIPEERHA